MEKKYLFSAVAAGVALSASVYASEIAGNNMFSSLSNVAMVADGNGMAKAADDDISGDEIVEDKWIDVELATAGSLGVEVLYNVDVLTDVEYLKVTGTLNSTDWTTITQMKNLKALDLRNAKLESIPADGCKTLTSLAEIYLPEGLKTIGNYAFRYTQLQKITIPSSVTSIGERIFYEVTTLEEAEFAEGSQLTSIPTAMFRGCNKLTTCILPKTLISIGTYAFYNCNELSSCVLPESLKEIGTNAFYRNYKITTVEFPQGLQSIGRYAYQESGIESVILPIGLSTLGDNAFHTCKSLTFVELPSYIEKYDDNFRYCTAIKKVVLHSATPPAINGDPFGNVTKANIEIVVPSFAVVNYKLDSYWYQFGSIVGGVESDYWKITAPLSLTNNRRMDGKPSIDMYYNGQLTVGGNAPMEVATLNMFMSDDTPARIVNTCNAMTADELNTTYKVDANKWYFLSPMHDVNLADIEHSVAGASFVFRYYDGEGRATNGPGSSWKNVTDDVLVAGQGYIFQCNKAGEITMPSTAESIGKMLTADDVVAPLATYASENTANQNWNMVGNPYPCYYDIYYMDFTAPITVWDMSSRTYKAYSLVDDNLVLRPMQAFFVQKPDNVDNITFDKDGRQMESTINRASYAPARNARISADRKLFNIVISDGEMSDETRVVINSEASDGYEMDRDASKFMSMSDDVPQIYTVDAEGNSLAINERPMLDGKIALSVYAAKAGFHTISLGRADGDISLYDVVEGRTVNLNSEDYTFYVDEAGVLEGRFMLMPAVDNNPTGIGSIDADGMSVTAGKGMLRVTASDNVVVNVYTADGKKAAAATAVAGVAEFNLAAGVYVVSVNGKTVKSVVY